MRDRSAQRVQSAHSIFNCPQIAEHITKNSPISLDNFANFAKICIVNQQVRTGCIEKSVIDIDTDLADEVARLIVAAWPREVSGPIADQIHSVLTTARGDVLTLGAVFVVYFSSSGIESLRIGLNRAYGLSEQRAWWLLRLESIGYVFVSAISFLVLAFLVVLGPLMFRSALAYAPFLRPLAGHDNFARLGVAAVVLAIALLILHMWLPAGRRRLNDIWPGIFATLVLWLACGFIFGRYFANFSYACVTYYAGLASAMTALVFLYFSAWIFIFGGELNAAIARARDVAT